MSLLQQACETYDHAERDFAGIYVAGQKEPLAPIGHTITNAKIEIALDLDGNFLRAEEVSKEDAKTIFPVTEDSSGRTSAPSAHPLCEQIGYLTPDNSEKYQLYLSQLEDWANSKYSHPILKAILNYVKKGTIIHDLAAEGIVKKGKNGLEVDEKAFVRWRVLGVDNGNESCWKNRDIQDAFIQYYLAKKESEDSDEVCMVIGKAGAPAKQHAKGIMSLNGNAKLISANDTANFTFRGRFIDDKECLSVSYLSSQKAHNALRWIIANQGTYYGGRCFICWSPQGKKLGQVLNCV